MKFANYKLKKIALIVIITIIAMVGLSVIFISPIAKYLIEKYDVSYTGRQIKVGWAYVNPFTGYVYINNVKIYEFHKDTIFFSAKSVSASFSMRKILFNTCEITELNIDRPWGIVIQKDKDFNFNDLIETFRPDSTVRNRSPVHFNISRIRITHGEFHYREKIIPINYFIKDVNIESTGKQWDADTIGSVISFVAGAGHVNGNFTINIRTLDYRLATVIHHLDMELIRQYLWELINYGMFRAGLDANIKASGNFHDPEKITMNGRLAINDFHLGKTITEDYASFKSMVLVMDELSPENQKYLFDSVTLDNSFFSFERFDSLDNVQAMFGKKGSNISSITNQPGRFNLVIEISRYIRKLSRNFFESQYRINSLAINKGNVKFSDYSLNEKFSIQANVVNIKADSITKTNKRVKFYLESGIYPYGNSSATLSLNPLDSGDLDLSYRFHKVPITVFNPYVISYTSFPLDKGTLELNGAWKVRDGVIKSENNIMLIHPRVASRIRNKDTKWLPLPLIMSFVRERGDIINYKIPITGNLRNPKFHLQDVIIDLFKNVLIKPPTIPYWVSVEKAAEEIERAFTLTWKMRQYSLEPEQHKLIKKMARFLKENKGDYIDVYTQQYALKEMEHILFFETKKKYFLLTHNKSDKDFGKADSIQVDKMSIKDLSHVLVKNLKKKTRDTTMFTIQDKCNYFLGENRTVVKRKYSQLLKTRENAFLSYFIKAGTANRVKMHKSKNTIPYDGFSCFKIKYNGDIPKSLQHAYEDIHEPNHNIFTKKIFEKKGSQ